jgi:hypothetical protein
MTALSSAELFGRVAGVTFAGPLRIRNERCACGGWILANAEDPGPAVLRHNQTGPHRHWWARVRGEWQGEA